MKLQDLRNLNGLFIQCFEADKSYKIVINNLLLDSIRNISKYTKILPNASWDEPNIIRLEVKFKKFTVIGFNYSAYSDFDSHDAELEFIGVTIFN